MGSADSLLLARLAERDKSIPTHHGHHRRRRPTRSASSTRWPSLRPACAAPCSPTGNASYDTFSPHQDPISERLATLVAHLAEGEADVVLVPATTALAPPGAPSFLAGYTFHFKTKQKLDEASSKRQLTLAGYSHVSQVVSPGEYAVRGGLIDLFPPWARSCHSA